MDPSLTLFAIDAGVKIGKKINDILVNDTQEEPLILPLGDLYGSIQQADAVYYFDTNPELTAAGGPYAGISSDEEKLKAYKTIKKISDEAVISETEAVAVLKNLKGFEQFKEGFGQKPVFQQFLGTVVEIGIDYLQAYPSTIKDENARKYISAFLDGIDETDFADGDWNDILSDFFISGLKVFDDNVSDIVSDKRVSVILGGMTSSLLTDVQGLAADDLLFKQDFIKRAGASLLKGALEAASENSDLYLGQSKSESKKLTNAVLTNVLKGLSGQEDLFSNDSIKVIMKSAMLAVSENAGLISDNAILSKTIEESLSALADSEDVFSKSSYAVILKSGLDAIALNSAELVGTGSSGRVFLAETVSALAKGLENTLASGNISDLISTVQMNNLVKILFDQVAEDPQILLGETPQTGKKAVLTQIVASVFKSLGEDPAKVASGQGLIDLLTNVTNIALTNVDQFIKLDNEDPTQNLLYKVMHTVIQTVQESDDPRKLITKQTQLDLLSTVLMTVSENVDALAPDQSDFIKMAISKTLEVAASSLKGNINSLNFPEIIGAILVKADSSIFGDDEDFKNLIINTLRK